MTDAIHSGQMGAVRDPMLLDRHASSRSVASDTAFLTLWKQIFFNLSKKEPVASCREMIVSQNIEMFVPVPIG